MKTESGKWAVKWAVTAAALAVSPWAMAENSVLAGRFDGSEPQQKVIWEFYSGMPPLATRTVTFTVSESGTYRMEDAFEYWYFERVGQPGLKLINALYQGSFNPQDAATNRAGTNQYNAWPRRLEAGVEYTLVLQNPDYSHSEGVWTLAFNGPGKVLSSARVELPGLGRGRFTGSESTSTNSQTGETAIYQVQGPFTVSRDGIYYVTNLSHLGTPNDTLYANQLSFTLYSAPPQPENPELNRLEWASFYRGSFSLQAGEDYYLLVHSVENRPLDYFFLVSPPAPFKITPHLSGLWADPETDGQGLMLNVYPQINSMHLAWYTYDLEPVAGPATAQIGDAGQRWLTAFGVLDGAGSGMTITRTAGGIFDAAQPVPAQIQDGSVEIHFDSCTSGTLDYDLGSAHATGQLQLRRPFEDRASINRCELATAGPGIPGQL